MCSVLDRFELAVKELGDLPRAEGPGAAAVLDERLKAVSGGMAVLQRVMALTMADAQAAGPRTDVVGDAVREGVPRAQAGQLRRLGAFAREHMDVAEAWGGPGFGSDHVKALRDAAGTLPHRLRREFLDAVLPLVVGRTAADARLIAQEAADRLDPGCPDGQEQADHAARTLDWSQVPNGGGIAITGYLPANIADAFTAAINAFAKDLRGKDDGLTPGQRRADALAAMVSLAEAPTGGGLPACLTMTVSITEAQRIAGKDPNQPAPFHIRPRGGATYRNGRPAGDAAVRFALCCGAVTPVLHEPPDPASALGLIAATPTAPLAVGRAVRLATAAQRKALRLRDGHGCAIPGCTVPDPFPQPHHVTGWALDGPTNLDNLVAVCFVHHEQAELGRIRFTPRTEPKPDGAHEHPLWWITT